MKRGDHVSVELRPLTDQLSSPNMINECVWNSGGAVLTGEYLYVYKYVYYVVYIFIYALFMYLFVCELYIGQNACMSFGLCSFVLAKLTDLYIVSVNLV
jgi:hypothetical protein